MSTWQRTAHDGSTCVTAHSSNKTLTEWISDKAWPAVCCDGVIICADKLTPHTNKPYFLFKKKGLFVQLLTVLLQWDETGYSLNKNKLFGNQIEPLSLSIWICNPLSTVCLSELRGLLLWGSAPDQHMNTQATYCLSCADALLALHINKVHQRLQAVSDERNILASLTEIMPDYQLGPPGKKKEDRG